jgi:hypothetical protein
VAAAACELREAAVRVAREVGVEVGAGTGRVTERAAATCATVEGALVQGTRRMRLKDAIEVERGAPAVALGKELGANEPELESAAHAFERDALEQGEGRGFVVKREVRYVRFES